MVCSCAMTRAFVVYNAVPFLCSSVKEVGLSLARRKRDNLGVPRTQRRRAVKALKVVVEQPEVCRAEMR